MTEPMLQNVGIDWITEIPSSWTLRKAKYLFSQRQSKGNSTELQLLTPSQQFGVIPQRLYEELSGQRTVKLNEKTDLSLLKTVRPGDFCISLRSFQGGFEYSNYNGVVSQAYQIFFPKNNNITCSKFYKYLFKSSCFISKMNSYTLSLRDGKNIAYKDFSDTYLPVPPLLEQNAIANFLDNKCAEIDALTADIKKQIETLQEYKKSIITEAVTKGLDPKVETKLSEATWFKIAPLNWKIIPLKYCVSICTRKSLNNLNYIGLENVKSWDGIVDRSTNPITSEGDALNFEKGDVLFGKLRPYLAKCFIAEEDGCCSTEFLVMKPISIDGNYLKYLLLSNIFIDTVNMSTYGVKMPRASWDLVGNIKIPNPPIEEQSKIATYLDDRCESLNSLITQKNTQINMLTKYKQSLIYEYVTGKKTVPNA